MLTGVALADRVEMVVRPVGADTYRAAAVDGSVTFRRVADGRPVPSTTWSAPTVATRWASSPPTTSAATATSGPSGIPTVHGTPTPMRSTRSRSSSTHRTGPTWSRPTRRATPATATSASTARWARCRHGRRSSSPAPARERWGWSTARPGSSTSRPPSPRCSGWTRTPTAADRPASGAGTHCSPDRTVTPWSRCSTAAPPSRWSWSCSTAATPTCSTTSSRAGEAPHVAELVGRGTDYRHGAFASLPTATLANHTTAVTGAHPGHSGVLHNTWFDRRDGSVPDLLGFDQMFWAMRHLSPQVETLFQALQPQPPGCVQHARPSSSATRERPGRASARSATGSAATFPTRTPFDTSIEPAPRRPTPTGSSRGSTT